MANIFTPPDAAWPPGPAGSQTIQQPFGIKPLSPPGRCSNYVNWAFAMDLLMREAQLSYVLEDVPPAEQPESWERDSLRVCTLLTQCADEKNYDAIRPCGTNARAMWIALQKAHQNAAADTPVSCLMQLMTMRLTGDDVDGHLDAMNLAFDDLNTFTTPHAPLTADNVFAAALLSSLPLEWSELTTSLSQSSNIDSRTIIRAIRNARKLISAKASPSVALESTSSIGLTESPRPDGSFDPSKLELGLRIKEESLELPRLESFALSPSKCRAAAAREPNHSRLSPDPSFYEGMGATKDSNSKSRAPPSSIDGIASASTSDNSILQNTASSAHEPLAFPLNTKEDALKSLSSLDKPPTDFFGKRPSSPVVPVATNQLVSDSDTSYGISHSATVRFDRRNSEVAPSGSTFERIMQDVDHMHHMLGSQRISTGQLKGETHQSSYKPSPNWDSDSPVPNSQWHPETGAIPIASNPPVFGSSNRVFDSKFNSPIDDSRVRPAPKGDSYRRAKKSPWTFATGSSPITVNSPVSKIPENPVPLETKPKPTPCARRYDGTIKKAPKMRENYLVGETVLAQVDGWPAWPARVMDHSCAPPELSTGRRNSKNLHLLRFFGTGNYYWLNGRSINSLAPTDIKRYVEMDFSQEERGYCLETAFKIALEPEAWEAELDHHEDDPSHQTEEEMENTSMQFWRQDIDYEVPALPPKSPGPEEFPLSSRSERKGPAKSKLRREASPPKVNKRPRLVEPNTSHSSASKKKAGSFVSKKKTEAGCSSEMGAQVVLGWKLKLQKSFLSGESKPTAKMMPDFDRLFKEIEIYDMKGEWVIASKLDTTMKLISKLENGEVALDAKYRIRDRAWGLYQQWLAGVY